MISRLQISNYAIIEELDLDFANGLSIITGETGAGKSILLGALNLILGGRADTKTLFEEDRKCVIEGRFKIDRYNLKGFFETNDLDYDDEVIIRREITPSGKSRAFVNDTPTNLKILQQLGNALIDLHQQFDTLDINNSSFQLKMLDALAEQTENFQQYQRDYRELQQAKRSLAVAHEEAQRAHREREFVQYQFDELEAAALVADEQEKLETEQTRLGNAEEIKQLSTGVFNLISEDDNCINDQLLAIIQQLSPLSRGDAGVNEIKERFLSVQLDLEALSTDVQAFGEATEHNPERLGEVNERLDLIYRLQNKHQLNSAAELLDLQNQLSDKLLGFADLSGRIDKLERLVEQLDKKIRKRGLALRKARQSVAPDFTYHVHEQLVDLSMSNAKLEVDFQELPDGPGPYGLDEVRFLFSANKGGRMQTIKDAASGGEMSRLALVMKSLVATAMALPTLIFDEIDSGVSGDVAQKMGQIIARLSKHHQVIVITHSPQVASRADRHFFIYKTDLDDRDRTITKVRQLTRDERIRAIATMLSQNPPSDSAMNNAQDLIAAAE
ncbi:DNA repair protein RecN [Lewinellaceae bacterium SD302]|nr:DNA repair protein RecN [Lewinellaceae bacterium SD302]